MGRRAREELSDSEREKIREVKEDLCEALRKVVVRRGWTQKMMAMHLGTSQACVSRIIRYRTENLTLNQLFHYLARIEPRFEILVSIY